MSDEKITWLTPKEAGSILGYTARHIQKMISYGKLPATREDGKYYIDKKDFHQYLSNSKKLNKRLKKEDEERLYKELESIKIKYNDLEKELNFAQSLIRSLEKNNDNLKKTLKSYHENEIKMLGLINSLTGLLSVEKFIGKLIHKKTGLIRTIFRL